MTSKCNTYSGRIIVFLFLLITAYQEIRSQTIDHWETVVMASDIWSYLPGDAEPPSDWADVGFNDALWQTGYGGIGYGDNDDMTIINPVTSVYMRTRFTLVDVATVSIVMLQVDFDDGFVAYLNGHEIARVNLGTSGIKPSYDEFAILNTYEARLPSGGQPLRFIVEKGTISDYLIQGENVLALQVHNCDAESSDLSSSAYLSVAVTDYSHYYREPPSWFVDPATETSHLPLIVIDTWGQTITDDPKIIAGLKVIDNGPGKINNQFQQGTDYDGYMGIELRGQSSQMFPKKSYLIETQDEKGTNLSAGLLGMPADEDWILYAPYSDKTLLRNALTYYLGSRTGGWQPRFRFCEVYLNGENIGIYMLIEKIKRGEKRVDINKLKPDEISGDDLTGGYIIKTDKLNGLTTDEYFGINPVVSFQECGGYKFTYVYPKADEITSQQKEYIINYITDLESTLNGDTFSDPDIGFRKYLNSNSFVNFQIIQELTKNIDGYELSNYFYKKKDSDGGKLFAGPVWDFDLGYGNEDFLDFHRQAEGWLYSNIGPDEPRRMHWWARLMEDLSYRSVFINKWKSLRNGAFSTDSVIMYLDNTIGYLGQAIGRNFEKWPIIGQYVWPNYFIGDTYEDEVSYLKNWFTDRVNWIDANIMLAENVSGDFSGDDILLYPNPARDKINLNFYLTFSGEIRIEIIDLLGRKVFDDEMLQENQGYQYVSLDISKLAQGYYVIQVFQGGRRLGRGNILVSDR